MKALELIADRNGNEMVVDQHGNVMVPGIDIVSIDNWDEPLQYSYVLDLEGHKEILDEVYQKGLSFFDHDGRHNMFRPVRRNTDYSKGTVELAFDTKQQLNAFERKYIRKA